MEIQKHTGEKLEDYFSRLVAEGFEFDASYQNITLADIESVLRRLKQRCTRGYKRYKETSGLIEWKECQIFHSIFT